MGKCNFYFVFYLFSRFSLLLNFKVLKCHFNFTPGDLSCYVFCGYYYSIVCMFTFHCRFSYLDVTCRVFDCIRPRCFDGRRILCSATGLLRNSAPRLLYHWGLHYDHHHRSTKVWFYFRFIVNFFQVFCLCLLILFYSSQVLRGTQLLYWSLHDDHVCSSLHSGVLHRELHNNHLCPNLLWGSSVLHHRYTGLLLRNWGLHHNYDVRPNLLRGSQVRNQFFYSFLNPYLLKFYVQLSFVFIGTKRPFIITQQKSTLQLPLHRTTSLFTTLPPPTPQLTIRLLLIMLRKHPFTTQLKPTPPRLRAYLIPSKQLCLYF